ncbi:MAG: hypothetical protein ABI386_11945 [Rhodanobacter sp.]
MRMRDHDSRHPYRRRYRGVMPALIVIAAGAFFLLGNLGYDLGFYDRNNWWAWLILIAAAVRLAEAAQRYRDLGRIDGGVLHSVFTALVIVMVALMFILSLSWSVWWPVFVIYGGLCMLARGWRPEQEREAN